VRRHCQGDADGRALQLQSGPVGRAGLARVYSAEMIPIRPIGPTPRSSERPSVAAYRVGDLLVDVGRGQVSRGKQDLALPKLSLDLLIALVRAAPNLLTMDELMEQVWPGIVVSPETLTQRVKLLRASLGDDSKAPRYIAAVRGRGYRILAEVSVLESSAPTADPAVPVSAIIPVRGSTKGWQIGILMLLVTALAGGLVVWSKHGHESASVTVSRKVVTVSAPVRSIAVLPFDNLSPAADGAAIALGMSEAVHHRLANLNELQVIARTSSFAFQGHQDVHEIAEKLHTHYLLEGSVQSDPTRMRITAQLIDASTGVDVWSIRLDRPLQDIFTIQDEIASAVAQSLQLSMDAAEHQKLAGRGTGSFDAWLAYQQGRALLATRRATDIEGAKRRFERAIKVDPNFASAYASLAEAYVTEGFVANSEYWFGVASDLTPSARSKVEALLAQSLSIDPDNGEPYLVRGWLNQFDPSAEADFRRGLALSPNNAAGMVRFARVLYRTVDPATQNFDPASRAASFALIEHARQLDPLSATVHLAKAIMVAYGHGDLKQAIELTQQSLAQDPNFYPALTRLAEFKSESLGDLADAVKYAEQALALEPSSLYTRHLLSRLYLQLEDYDTARQVIAEPGTVDEMGKVALLLYRQEWRLAGETANKATAATLFDWVIALPAEVRLIMLPGGNSQAAKDIEDTSPVKWSTAGEPTLAHTIIDTETPIAVAELLIASGQKERGNRLLRLMLAAMDRDARELGRGDVWFCDSRPPALALLGQRDAALDAIQRCKNLFFPLDWWYHLPHAPAYDSIRQDPRFQTYLSFIRSRVEQQRKLLLAMRKARLIPARSK
jgi:TolB-like protein/DNA-binding winged helix-turn-helix (wHTH) protein/Tfp pilus assembly protein PilF